MGILKVIRKIKDPGSHGNKRSPEWSKVRKEHIKNNPACAACGSILKCEVHHIKPFHDNPELELDPNNLITLCEARKWLTCHLFTGHLGSYKNDNPDVRKDAAYIKDMLDKKG
jgi:hypothetical protein